jgi:hypothetical protein
MENQQDPTITTAISANLAALASRLSQAANFASQACKAMEDGNQNRAIGTILYFEESLPEALHLYNAVMALHKSR